MVWAKVSPGGRWQSRFEVEDGKANEMALWGCRRIVYAYIPITDTLCSQAGVICNSDYGTSLGRGSFSFQRGAWNEIALYVQLNEPVTTANGVVE